MSEPLLPGTLYLIDTSAMARLGNVEVEQIIAGILDLGVAATCVTVDLEAGYSGRNGDEAFEIYEARTSLFTNLPITEVIAHRARAVQLLMAKNSQHRAAGVIDLLSAAVAEHYRATILHYNADFEHIAKVTGQRQQWIVPRGTVG